MLLRLFVKNFALVENLEFNFDKNFVVLTGETGAGKSLLIGALSYLLGAKFDSSLLLRKGEECIIEGTFLGDPRMLNSLSFEDKDCFILKRKFDKTGRNWAYLNGETISINRLKALAEELVEINGQHQGTKLLNEETHLKILDSHKNISPLSEETAFLSREIKDKLKFLRFAEGKISEVNRRIEMLQEEISEIDKVNPRENEDEELKIRKKIVENSAKIYENLLAIISRIKSEDNSILSQLKDVINKAEELSFFKENWKELFKDLENSRIVLAEVHNIAEKELQSLEFEADELEKIQERLYKIEKLQRKYGPELKDVILRRNSNIDELNRLKSATFDKETLKREVQETFEKYLQIAKNLSKAREREAAVFSKNVTSVLKHLALEKGRFEVNFTPLKVVEPEDANEKGLEEVQFLFSANEGEPLLPLSKIASGGELSRVLLAILSSSKTNSPNRTVIFDEIDAGIGGKPAEKVGIYLDNLSENNQVICVTHLPQIAAYADQHIKIEKTMKGGKTTVNGKVLSLDERIEELGRMVAGEAITQSALIHARELLKIAKERKDNRKKT